MSLRTAFVGDSVQSILHDRTSQKIFDEACVAWAKPTCIRGRRNIRGFYGGNFPPEARAPCRRVGPRPITNPPGTQLPVDVLVRQDLPQCTEGPGRRHREGKLAKAKCRENMR